MFNPKRLTFARRRRGLKKTELARLIEVDLRSITGYESGEYAPDTEKLDRIATELRFPVEFFYEDDIEELEQDIASFRSMKKMRSSQRDMALTSGAIALLLDGWINARFELPTPDLPDLGRNVSPEAAAEELRRYWGLGDQPISNMVHLLESKGIRVFSLALDAVEVDAFSMWHGAVPFVFLNTLKSAEHGRFDGAHELGHLVMHRHGLPDGQDAEKEANAFASAFLMPRTSVLASCNNFISLDSLIGMKRIWGVSVAALAYRLHEMGRTSEWLHRTLYIQISQAGYRKEEPNPMPRETSQVLAKVFAALREEGIHKQRVAKDLKILTDEINELTFGLLLSSAGGSPKVSDKARHQKTHLRLVK